MADQSLFRIFDHLATHRRKTVLMQGRSYWRIEDLFAQAKRDMKSSENLRKALLDPVYTVNEESGQIVIRRFGKPEFTEPGLYGA